jgi:hypothetical protein
MRARLPRCIGTSWPATTISSDATRASCNKFGLPIYPPVQERAVEVLAMLDVSLAMS